jgi:hypothetical protein
MKQMKSVILYDHSEGILIISFKNKCHRDHIWEQLNLDDDDHYAQACETPSRITVENCKASDTELCFCERMKNRPQKHITYKEFTKCGM